MQPRPRSVPAAVAAAAGLLFLLSACSSSPTGTGSDDQAFPEVVDATLEQATDGTWSAVVTLSSPYDTPERYADAWRLSTVDGTEIVVRVLTHDHADEQPFTRSQSGFAIPAEATAVIVHGRDLVNGWGPDGLEVPVHR